MAESFPFIPGLMAGPQGLLARYLPPVPEGVAAAWLAERLPPGAWILDPFGAAPGVAAEAARASYRVLVAANNPIARFLLELSASPPSEEQLRSALAELAATRKGDERLEPHIRNLYATVCQQCGEEVIAEAFLWERDAEAPYGRIYHCPKCGDAGERPATKRDREKAIHFAAGGLHLARALERIAGSKDPDRGHAEEALAAYLPRAVYAVFTLINKLDSIAAPASGGPPDSHRRDLAALLLSALDQANSLWPYPTARARPRQLTKPRRFRENNVWMALEEAVEKLASPLPPVPLVSWPETPPESGGIVVFEGRLRELAEALQTDDRAQARFGAVLAALPRPNQAYWTLSALWAGWLWGRDAIGPFKSVLRRRRYDWAWHCTALEAAFGFLAGLLPEQIPFLGLVGEAESGFLSAVMLAAERSGLHLRGIALRAESEQAQILWKGGTPPVKRGPKVDPANAQMHEADIPAIAAETGLVYLRQRGEPAAYLSLHAAALLGLVEGRALAAGQDLSPGDEFSRIQESFEAAFTYRNGFLRFAGSDKSLEVGQWWLRESGAPGGEVALPLADRVEMEVVRALQKTPASIFLELDGSVCAALPGMLTPGQDLVLACLESYGEQEPSESGLWRLRAQDRPAERQADISAMRKALHSLAGRLAFHPSGEDPLLWLDDGGKPAYVFYLLASAVFAQRVISSPYPASQSLLVLPGARASLAVFKLRRDPHLRQAVEAGWRFLKFRHLRQLLESRSLSRANLDEQLALDPLTGAAEQMRLL